LSARIFAIDRDFAKHPGKLNKTLVIQDNDTPLAVLLNYGQYMTLQNKLQQALDRIEVLSTNEAADIGLGGLAKTQYRQLMERANRPLSAQDAIEELRRVRSLVRQISESTAADQQIVMPPTTTSGPLRYLYRSKATPYVFFRRVKCPKPIAILSTFCERTMTSAAHSCST
jgi:hypothetical protein